MSFDHTKDASVKCELPLVDLEFIALLTGKSLSTGAVNVPKRQVLYASAGNTITLASTPVAGTLKLYLLTGGRDNGTEQIAGTPASVQNTYSISGTTVTLNSTTAPLGTGVIATYNYSAPSTTQTMTFTADKFPGYFRITGEGLATDADTGATVPVKFEILKCKPQNNFNITIKSSRLQ